MITEMDPGYLTAEELEYKLRIRGLGSSNDDSFEKRKALKRVLAQELHRQVSYEDSETDEKVERAELRNSIAGIATIVDDLEVDTDRTLGDLKRANSRLIHVEARLMRAVKDKEKEKSETAGER